MNYCATRYAIACVQAALALAFFASHTVGQESKVSHSYRVALASQIEMVIQGSKQKVVADTEFRYTWQRTGGKKSLLFNGLSVKALADGKERVNTSMSRGKIVVTKEGQATETLFANAPEELKKVLQDSFDVPVCHLHVDENGREMKREIVAGPGAKAMLDNGALVSAIFFHDPYFADRFEWEVDSECSMGDHGSAKGKLTLSKDRSGAKPNLVRVTGTLSKEGFKRPNSPLMVKAIRYVVTGEQTFDPARQDWESGKRTMDISFDLEVDDKAIGSAKGTMIVGFERLKEKKP